MLQIMIPAVEQWDEKKNEFVYSKSQVISLEHSLVSISKWESKWCKPFLSKNIKTTEETIDYIKCMTLTQNVDPDVYNRLSKENIAQINKYIEAPMTATWFSEENKRSSPNCEQITAELIYYWMIALNIPFECQKWHLNRLLTLIRVCNVKNQPPKKMSKRQLLNRNAALNALRRKQASSKGR
jgi:hypothetical protein